MDEGILRVCRTKTEALAWAVAHFGPMQGRKKIYAGSYIYRFGYDGEDNESLSKIVIATPRELMICGWDPEQEPLYPDEAEPWKQVDRPERTPT